MNTNNKINQEFLKHYSSVFADKLLKSAYETKQHLTGKDILNLSSIKQLNLFVIKAFFNQWQEEVKRLESPLFDYTSKEVRRSMIDFMNTLSQHISIEQVHLKPYVEQALRETLQLASNVHDYLAEEFADKKSTRVNAKFIKSQLKYIVLHKELLQEFFASVEGETVREALNKSTLFFEDIDSSETEDELISLLSQYLVLERGDLFIPSFQASEPIATQEEEQEETYEEIEESSSNLTAASSDYFGAVAQEEATEVPAEEDEEEESITEDDTDEESEEEVAEHQVENEYEAPESTYENKQFGNDEIAEQEEADELEGEENLEELDEEKTVAAKYEVDQKTLAELHEEQKIESVFEAISINHRYMFLQELFDGDNELFTSAMKDVDACTTFDEAVEMLVQNYAKDFFWDMNSDEVKELLKVVYRKFRS